MKKNIYVHVPYERLETYLENIKEKKVNIELYFSSAALDTINSDILEKQRDLLIQMEIKIILHAPFIDLSPGAFDSKVKKVTINRFLHTIEIAKFFGATSIVCHPGYDTYKHQAVFNKWYKNSLKTWFIILEALVGSPITINIENIFETKPTVVKTLLKELGSQHFGHCFDAGHFNMFSEISLNQWILETHEYIKEFHMHNNYRISDNHNSLKDGTFDFEDLFLLIKEYNIKAKFTIEAHGIKKVYKSLDDLGAYMMDKSLL